MPEPLTPQELFDTCEWHSRDSLVKLFPSYFQEQYAMKKKTGKEVLNKSVNIENFTMKTPFGDQELLKGTELILESNKRQGLVGANCTGTRMHHALHTASTISLAQPLTPLLCAPVVRAQVRRFCFRI